MGEYHNNTESRMGKGTSLNISVGKTCLDIQNLELDPRDIFHANQIIQLKIKISIE